MQKPINRIVSYLGVLGRAATVGCVLVLDAILIGLFIEPPARYDRLEPNDPWTLFHGLTVVMIISGLITLYFLYDTNRKNNRLPHG